MPCGNPGMPRAKKPYCKHGHPNIPENRCGSVCRVCRQEGSGETYNGRYRKGHQKSQALKCEVLTKYGLNGALQCCWPECCVVDVDMLTLDHINNDGFLQKNAYGTKVGGASLYVWAKQNGYPKTLQTMCWNHQWKKRLSVSRIAKQKIVGEF
jgi:hypothetical protein